MWSNISTLQLRIIPEVILVQNPIILTLTTFQKTSVLSFYYYLNIMF